jgi:hypothetical protein
MEDFVSPDSLTRIRFLLDDLQNTNPKRLPSFGTIADAEPRRSSVMIALLGNLSGYLVSDSTMTSGMPL